MPRIKRKPGGQPGNDNAFKHGFYADGLKQRQQFFLRRAATALDMDGLAAEIALARSHLAILVSDDPTNYDILVRLLNALTRMIATDYKLSRNEEIVLGESLQQMLDELRPGRDI